MTMFSANSLEVWGGTPAALQGKPVVFTEDVHNTRELWIAFARMFIENGTDVVGIASLTSTE